MSHHFNLDMSVNEKKPSPGSKESNSAKRRETKKLEIDNKQMEWRLNQLKLAMEKQKEERGKQSYIWKSAQDSALDSHARNILGRSVKSSSKSLLNKNSAKGKPKVKVLTDEPLDLPKRKSHSKELIEKLKRPSPPKKKSPVSSAHSNENVNNECWISVAMDRTSDDIFELQSDKEGNLPLSSLHGLNPAAIGLFYMQYGRKRLLLAIENKVIQPKAGWKTEVYFPYVANTTPQKLNVEPKPPSSSRSVVIKNSSPKTESTGGQLLNGSFNEEENAKAFQKALLEWRNGKRENLSQPVQRSVEMVVHDVQSDPVSVDINFSETSTLTYMEKLLVKKHRETAVPPLPSSYDTEDNEGPLNQFSLGLTKEELEEQARIRELFTPQPSTFSRGSSATFDIEHTCRITEVDDALLDIPTVNRMEQEQNETICYVEEQEENEDNGLLSMAESNNTKISHFPSFEEVSLCYSANNTDNANDEMSYNIKKGFQNLVDGISPSTSYEEEYPESDSKDDSSFKVSQDMKMKLNISLDSESNQEKLRSYLNNNSEAMHPVSSLVHAIGDIPLNPDAVYHTDVATLQAEMVSEQDQLRNNLDQPSSNIMLCSQTTSLWNVSDSVSFNPNVQDIGISENAQSFAQLSENAEREIEDTQALDQLEWELASQTGNVTIDGRISRLIDDWSSDDDQLDIVNDPGLGSGLSTPDHDPINLVGTSMSWQEDDRMQEEFKKMENLMFADVSSDESDSNCSRNSL